MHARFVRVDYILDHYYLACIVVIGLVINMIESYYRMQMTRLLVMILRGCVEVISTSLTI